MKHTRFRHLIISNVLIVGLLLPVWVQAQLVLIQTEVKLSEQEIAQCQETLTNLNLRGFRLGMTAADVKKLYPEIKIPYADVDGLSDTEIFYIVPKLSSIRMATNKIIDRGKYAELDGLLGLALTFVDYQLSSIMFFYESNARWKDEKEFSKNISEKLNLPDRWTFLSKTNLNTGKMLCGQKGIVVGLGKKTDGTKQPILSITDIELRDKINQRADKRENDWENLLREFNEQEKQNFKP